MKVSLAVAKSLPTADWLASARRALEIESAGLSQVIEALGGELGDSICDAIEIIRAAKGRVIMSGMGKSGHIARKIAATLASTGTPSLFVHPAEASHGDLGMITRDDVIVMISASGESVELKDMLAYARRFTVPLVAITSRADSTLAGEADVVLLLPAAQEACPIGLAPTTSTLLQLAIGDALAVTLLEDKGFSAREFREFHPAGKLGAALKHASDVMHSGDLLPLVAGETRMAEALLVMTEKSFGCLGIVGPDGVLEGIITDGDLRRHMSRDLVDLTARDVMTPHPLTISGDDLVGEVLELLNSRKITSVFVVDDHNVAIGLIHIHDLIRAGVA